LDNACGWESESPKGLDKLDPPLTSHVVRNGGDQRARAARLGIRAIVREPDPRQGELRLDSDCCENESDLGTTSAGEGMTDGRTTPGS
jgi:hypothetical protein